MEWLLGGPLPTEPEHDSEEPPVQPDPSTIRPSTIERETGLGEDLANGPVREAKSRGVERMSLCATVT